MIQKLLRWMALIGLNIREDPGIEERDPNREWGPVAYGLRLSAKARESSLSLVLKNVDTKPLRTSIPTWLFFYRLAITGPGGNPPLLSTFGERALSPTQNNRTMDLALVPGQATETDIPVLSLYQLEPGAVYRLQAECTIGGVVVLSNSVEFVASPRSA
jgi:hypothetical protein